MCYTSLRVRLSEIVITVISNLYINTTCVKFLQLCGALKRFSMLNPLLFFSGKVTRLFTPTRPRTRRPERVIHKENNVLPCMRCSVYTFYDVHDAYEIYGGSFVCFLHL